MLRCSKREQKKSCLQSHVSPREKVQPHSKYSIVPIKISAYYFMNINKLILKFLWRGKNNIIANVRRIANVIANVMKKKNKVG